MRSAPPRTPPKRSLLPLENLLTLEALSELVRVRGPLPTPTGSRRTSRPRRSWRNISTTLRSKVRGTRTKLSNLSLIGKKKPMQRSSSSAPNKRRALPPKLQSEEVIWSKSFPHLKLELSTSFSLTLPMEMRQAVPAHVLEQFSTIITTTLQKLQELSSSISSLKGSELPSPAPTSSSSPTSTSGPG